MEFQRSVLLVPLGFPNTNRLPKYPIGYTMRSEYICPVVCPVVRFRCLAIQSGRPKRKGQNPGSYKTMKRKTTYKAFDPAAYLDNDAVIAEYLSAAAEDPNPDVFVAALGDVAKARGMAQIAKDSGLGRESLYKALSAGAHPRFATINSVLRALGVKIAVVAERGS
jgi:probable addiction module antidote protein